MRETDFVVSARICAIFIREIYEPLLEMVGRDIEKKKEIPSIQELAYAGQTDGEVERNIREIQLGSELGLGFS